MRMRRRRRRRRKKRTLSRMGTTKTRMNIVINTMMMAMWRRGGMVDIPTKKMRTGTMEQKVNIAKMIAKAMTTMTTPRRMGSIKRVQIMILSTKAQNLPTTQSVS